jgi:hypothetical protein
MGTTDSIAVVNKGHLTCTGARDDFLAFGP